MTTRELFNRWFRNKKKVPVFNEDVDIVCNAGLIITKDGKTLEDKLGEGSGIKTITLYLGGDSAPLTPVPSPPDDGTIYFLSSDTNTKATITENLFFNIVNTEEEMNLLLSSYILKEDVDYILNNPFATVSIIHKIIDTGKKESPNIYDILYYSYIGVSVPDYNESHPTIRVKCDTLGIDRHYYVVLFDLLVPISDFNFIVCKFFNK